MLKLYFFRIMGMKNTILFLYLLLQVYSVFSTNHQRLTLQGEDSTIENTVRIIDNGFAGLRLEINLSELYSKEIITPKGTFLSLTSSDLIGVFEAGLPNIPVLTKHIEVPFGARVVIKVIGYNEQVVDLNDFANGIKVIPAQPSYSKSDDPKDAIFHFNPEAYSKNQFINSETVIYEEVGILRSSRLGRIEVRPLQYNPVNNQLKVLNNLIIDVVFDDADPLKTYEVKQSKYSPFFGDVPGLVNHPTSSKAIITSAPVTYVIVSDPMFQVALQPFIEWKRFKGFKVIEAYTSSPEVGTTTSSIKNYLQNLYNNPPDGFSSPTFGLLVGDVAQIPSFSGLAGSHKTDLYYFEYTNDKMPEVFYGRFSAQTVEQLIPQIEKTLMYEKYEMDDPSYLSDHVLIAGVDATWAPTYANGHIRYSYNNYSNSENGINPYTYLYNDAAGSTTGIASNNSAAATDIRNKMGVGVGWANYTAHCSSSGWSNPSFSTSHIPELANFGKYGVWIGNCCQSNRFDLSECFGEAALRAANKGAVGYIGGSNDTYWHEDYYFAVGTGTIVAFPEYQNFSTGMYDAVFHTKPNEYDNPAKWHVTQGQLITAGNLAVQASTSSRKNYYWEVYHLMGDPSLTPYLWEPLPMDVDFPIPNIDIDASEFDVNTAPFALISLSQNGQIINTTFANLSGQATLSIPHGSLSVGEIDMVITAQNRQPFIGKVDVTSSEPYANFYANPLIVIIGEDVTFTDASANGNFSTWEWTFGEGASPQTASGIGPHSVTYSTPGKKTISLVVDGQYERTRTNYINVKDIFTLTLNKIGNGNILVNGEPYSSPLQIPEGTAVSLNAVADTYNSFSEWTGDMASTLESFELIMNSNKTITAHFIEASSATYTEGDIPTDSNFKTLPGDSNCPGILVVKIPYKASITSVDVEYTITAANQGYKSEQRSQLRCISEGGEAEDAIINGVGNSGGTMVYSRKGLTIANGVSEGGDIEFELHAGRTWSTSGYNGCSTYNNKVNNGSWRVVVHYEPSDIKLPIVTVWPEATSIVYGSKLADSELNGGYAEFDGEQVDGTFSFKNAEFMPSAGLGLYSVKFSPTDQTNFLPVDGNVSVKVEPKSLTVVGDFSVESRIYDGTTNAAILNNQLALQGKVDGNEVNLVAIAQFTSKSAVPDKMVIVSSESTLEGAHSANYSLSLENAPTTTATIYPKPLLVKKTQAESKIYDGNTSAQLSGAEIDGLIAEDVVSLANHLLGVFAQKSVGNNIPISTSMLLEGDDAQNYSLVQPDDVRANIYPKELFVINATAHDKVYDGNDIASITGAQVEGQINTDDVSLTNHTQGKFEQLSVGTDINVTTSFSLAGEDSNNYSVVQPNIKASITHKVVKVEGSFTVDDKEYDGTAAATISTNNLVLSGLVMYDLVDLAEITAEFEDAEVGDDKKVFVVDASLGGDNSTNYSLSLQDCPHTTASIFAAPQQFTVAISVDGNGSVEVNGSTYSSPLSIVIGSEISLTAVPETSWKFMEWQGDAIGSENPLTIKIDSDKTIAAIFSPITSTPGISSQTGVKVFPNPFEASVSVRNLKGVSRIVVTNIIGQQLVDVDVDAMTELISIPTSTLAKGIYLFTFYREAGEKQVIKMVKK